MQSMLTLANVVALCVSTIVQVTLFRESVDMLPVDNLIDADILTEFACCD